MRREHDGVVLVGAETIRAPAGWRTLVAAVLATVSVGCSVAAIDLYRWNVARTEEVDRLFLADLVVGAAFPPMVAWIISRQPHNRLGWVMLSTALVGPWLLASQYAVSAVVVLDESSAWATFAAWLSMWGYAPYLVLTALVPLLFPDGTLPSARWRPYVAVVVAAIVVGIGARMLAPTGSDASAAVLNPLGVDGAGWLSAVTVACAAVCIPIGGTVGVVSLLVRARRANGPEQARLHVFVLGVVALVALAGVGPLLGVRGQDLGLTLGLLLLIAAIGVAVVRHGLFDVTFVLNRTLVYGVLTAAVLAGYVTVVAMVGRLTADTEPAYVAVAAAALIAAAGRDQAQRLVDRLLFGDRRDPYAVLQRVQTGLDLATGPTDALEQLADRLRVSLRLPYVEVRPADLRLQPATSGVAVPAVETLPLEVQGELVGDLLVGRRGHRERFGRREQTLLRDVAQRAGVLLHEAALVHDLQRSRERIVAAREEERRRLRRDVHDGIGPALAGMAMQLDGLADRLGEPALQRRAARVRDQMRQTVQDLRGVVDDLRPPALDDLGLRGALAEHLAGYAPLVRLDLRGRLPQMSAAVEVATYRIVTEAVANAARHAQASSCVVTLTGSTGWLLVEVRDDGVGLPETAVAGVGLGSMRERAAEVGGRFDVRRAAGGGTTVRARLPAVPP